MNVSRAQTAPVAALRADPRGGYARGVSCRMELRALTLAVACGCGTLSPEPSSSSPVVDAPRVAVPPRPAVLDAASAHALAPLPARLGQFSLDAYAGVRAFGADAALPIDLACERVLGPGCADDNGLERVVAVRYVDADGGRATLDVLVSRFEDVDRAYASFSEALLGERDPLALTAQPLDLPGLAALDGERVDGWLGRYVVSLVHGDETRPAEQRVSSAAAHLPASARSLLEALPAEPELPLAVQKLPRANRIPLAARLVPGDALGVPGMGMAAIGHYREQSKRWRVLAIVRSDDDSARDVLSTLSRNPAAHPIRNAPLGALSFTERRLPAEPSVGWVVGQRQEVIYGVGDEATALPEFMPAEREAAVKLSLLDKLVKLTRTHLE